MSCHRLAFSARKSVIGQTEKSATPLIRKFSDVMLHIILPLLILLTLGYLYIEHGTPRNPAKWIGFTYKGNVRAFAELSGGVIAFQISKNVSKFTLTKMGKFLVSLFEWCLYISFILYMYFEKAFVRDYLFICIMILALHYLLAIWGLTRNGLIKVFLLAWE